MFDKTKIASVEEDNFCIHTTYSVLKVYFCISNLTSGYAALNRRRLASVLRSSFNKDL